MASASKADQLALRYLRSLRRLIGPQLARSRLRCARNQIRDYPWLWGALGQIPSDVMFICENPSMLGVQRAHDHPLGGKTPDFESQWWGGPRDYAARRFRRVLCELGLKTTPWDARAGWKCYITNLVKEVNVVRDQNALCLEAKKLQAKVWAPILAWEIDRVRPRFIFCVGAKTYRLVRWLQRADRFPEFPVHPIWHYSSRGSDSAVRRRILDGINAVLRMGDSHARRRPHGAVKSAATASTKA